MKAKVEQIKAGLIECPQGGVEAQVTLSIGLNLATTEIQKQQMENALGFPAKKGKLIFLEGKK